MLSIGILEGDDIGHEVVPECIKVMTAAAARAKLDIAWKPVPIARRAHQQFGHTVPPGTLETLTALDGWVLGPIGHREYPRNDPTWLNAHPLFRTHFGLYANYKPFKSYPNLPSLHKGIDMLFLRETTEGFKVDANLFKGYGEFMPTEELAIGVCVTDGPSRSQWISSEQISTSWRPERGARSCPRFVALTGTTRRVTLCHYWRPCPPPTH